MNSFLQIAEQQISSPRKARQHAAEKRAVQKALAERDRQSRLWRTWRHQRVDALLAGEHGEAAQGLIAFLDEMTLDDPATLIAMADRWRDADADACFLVLALIDRAIIRLREQQGLPPFDDSLPGAPPTVFLAIRAALP
jgi:hypothetical protein